MFILKKNFFKKTNFFKTNFLFLTLLITKNFLLETKTNFQSGTFACIPISLLTLR